MSTIDKHRHARRRYKGKPRPKPKEVQLQMKLMGGLTPGEKKRGTPFDDAIPPLGDAR